MTETVMGEATCSSCGVIANTLTRWMEVSGLDAAGLCGLTEELKMQLNGEIVEDIHDPI